MFARSTIVKGDPAAIDAGISYVQGVVLPEITAMDGCVGLSMMVDRQTGHCITTSSWNSVEAMAATYDDLQPNRDRLAEMLGGIPQVDLWEVAVMHRDHLTHEGTCCRVTWLRTAHTEIDRGIDVYRTAVLPAAERMTGFCSASLMVNRDSARACTTTSFDTPEALEKSREQAWALRDRAVRDAGVDVMDVAEYELAVAHLRVPELV